jgi:putative transposase
MEQNMRVYLSPEERQYLETRIKKGIHSARLLTRARILLLADRSDGEWRRYGKIAKALHCNASTVGDICQRFIIGGLETALNDKPRPGRVPKLDGDAEARLVLLACSHPPEGRTRWTLKLLAEQLIELGLVESISEVAVYKRLKKMNLNLGKSKLGVSRKPALSL